MLKLEGRQVHKKEIDFSPLSKGWGTEKEEDKQKLQLIPMSLIC